MSSYNYNCLSRIHVYRKKICSHLRDNYIIIYPLISTYINKLLLDIQIYPLLKLILGAIIIIIIFKVSQENWVHIMVPSFTVVGQRSLSLYTCRFNMAVCIIRSLTAGREQQSGIEFIYWSTELVYTCHPRRGGGKEEQGELSASATVTVCNKLLLSLME